MRASTLFVALALAGCATIPETLPSLTGVEARLQSFAPTLLRGEHERAAVLFSYLPIDDPLQDHIPVYLNAIEETTSERIYNLALSDAMGADNTLFYRLQSDHAPEILSSSVPLSATRRELTTNDPATLASSVAWAYSRYPARVKAFSFLGHGGGFQGIASDLTPEGEDASRAGTMMGIQEFGTALKTGLKGRRLSLVHLHACLMANVEAAYELRDTADVLLASEDAIGASSQGTEKPTAILNTLLQQEAEPRILAREYVIRMNPKREPYGYSTASAIDLTEIANVKSALNGLARALIQAMPQHLEAISSAYEAVPEFRDYPDSGQRDLWTFCNRLYQGVPDSQVRAQALMVKKSLRAALLHTQDSQADATQGLSIYMPRLGDAGILGRLNGENYAKTSFAKDSLWDTFLSELNTRSSLKK